MTRVSEVQELSGHADRVWDVAWSPSGAELASCSGDRSVRIWKQTGSSGAWSCAAVLEDTHSRTIRTCSWSPDGHTLACASFDATTSIWEVQAGIWEQVAVLEGHENEVKAAAWSPQGTQLATCGRDKTVWIWEAEPGHEFECLDVKHGHSQDVKMVAWHPSGQVLVSCSYDDTIKLWVDDGDEWICQQTLSGPGLGHTSTVWGVAFSSDGSRMVSCSDDLSLHIWSCPISSGELPRWRLLSTVTGYHERTIFSVDWSKSGAIATGSGDNAIRIFEEDAPSKPASQAGSSPSFHMTVYQSQAHLLDVNCVRWHPRDPSLLASASDDGAVKLWRYHAQGSAAGAGPVKIAESGSHAWHSANGYDRGPAEGHASAADTDGQQSTRPA